MPTIFVNSLQRLIWACTDCHFRFGNSRPKCVKNVQCLVCTKNENLQSFSCMVHHLKSHTAQQTHRESGGHGKNAPSEI